MYEPPGLCLNDFDLSYNSRTGKYELIHIQGPRVANTEYDAAIMENTYGFAVSDDLVNWETQPPVFFTSKNGPAFDDSAIWTMQSFQATEDDRYLFYTGVSAKPYFQQKIGRAVYDPTRGEWQRGKVNPIISADGEWYQTEGFMAWRDPYVVRDEGNDRYVMFISAKRKDQVEQVNGCIGWAVSDNLKDWIIQPPLISPGCYYEMECPVYYRRGDYHYILVSVSDTRRVHVWRSRSFLSGYEEDGFLTGTHEYAPRIVPFEGRDVLLHTHWVQREDSTGETVWSRGHLSDPRVVKQDNEGRLFLDDAA